MPDIVDLAALRTSTRRKSDILATNRFSDAEVNDYVNEDAHEFYERVALSPADQYAIDAPCTTAATSGTVANWTTPANFWTLKGVDWTYGGTIYTLRKYNFMERNRWQFLAGSGFVPLFRQVGAVIRLSPAVSFDLPPVVWYQPTFPHLAVGAPAVNLDAINGWDTFVATRAAILMLRRNKQDTRDLERDLGTIWERILEGCTKRDMSVPDAMVDIEEQKYVHPFYRGLIE